MHANFYEKWFTRSEDINESLSKMKNVENPDFTFSDLVSTIIIFMNVIILTLQSKITKYIYTKLKIN